MKRIILLFFILVLVAELSFAQAPQINSTNNLYYLCKIWGYLKYFHTEIADGTIDWDNVLIQNINSVKNAQTADELNTALLNVINAAGTMQPSTAILPDVPAELKYNLNLGWFQDSYLTTQVRLKLENVQNLFRPRSNKYISQTSRENPELSADTMFCKSEISTETEQIKLLSLFRYWNIINYFFPYKNIIDNNWDDVLKEFIPRMINSTDDTSYNYTLLELSTYINDSHAAVSSKTVAALRGSYYIPLKLKYINGSTVISQVGKNITNCKPGDIIKRLNGRDVNIMRDSIKKYTAGSNEPTIQRNINSLLIHRRTGNPVNLEIESKSGSKTITLNVSNYTDYAELFATEEPNWKIINKESRYGYIHMGRLTSDQVPTMFNDLWNCDALIFDLRNYPNSTLFSIINFLFPNTIVGAHFTAPSVIYPGTLFWNTTNWLGEGDFSRNYHNQIYILFDEDTQSQAEFTVMHLEQHPKAVKIGSQTAGADGNLSTINLPYGVYSSFTGRGVFYPDGTPTQRIGIVPDIEVKPTIQGIRDERDEVLEAVFNHFYTTAVDKPNELPKQYSLMQNYPNPFNPATTIKYSVPPVETLHATSPQRISLKVYDLLGREIATLVNEVKQPGNYSVKFSAGSLPSGVYLYQISAGNYKETKKLMLLK